MRIRKLIIAIAFIHLLPVAAWAAFKPIRVVAPELLGLHCTDQGVCVDDLSRLDEATVLRSEAVAFVNSHVRRIEHTPRFIFCSASQCAKSFGFTSQAAYDVGTYALVISPRGWHPYFVRHELIHHVQNERLGSLKTWFSTPSWFSEGMAYSLSEDPRRPLSEPLEGWRSHFEQWYANIDAENVWQEAEKLR